MTLFVSLIISVLFVWFGVKQIRKFRFTQIAREYYARWSMLDTLEKKRLLNHCYPDHPVPGDETSMDGLFTSFVHKKWTEMKQKNFYDFEAFQIYLSKLIAFACRIPESTSMARGVQRLS